MNVKEKKDTHPEAHMPFYFADFFGAVEPYSDTVIVAYLRAIKHYWQQTHCTGIDDEDDCLKRICKVESVEWVRAKGIVFGRLFKLGEDGKWHQKRAKEEYDKAVKIYTAKVEWAAKARNRNPVNTPVTTPDNSPDTSPVNTPLAKTKPESKPDLNIRDSTHTLSAAVAAPALSDSEWLASLKTNSAYHGIDVDREYSKMTVWCQTNRKQPTRRRFINWLNRAEKPMAAGPVRPAANPNAPTKSEVHSKCKEKWGDDERWATWATSFYAHWNDPRRNWKRNDKSIDWQVELSQQVARWKIINSNK